MNKAFLLLAFLACSPSIFSQPGKPALATEDIAGWNHIGQAQLSPDGRWATYELQPNEGDTMLVLYDGLKKQKRTFPRSAGAAISADNRFLVFIIKPSQDSLRAQRRRKVKKEERYPDTLALYALSDGQLTRIPGVRSFQLPAKWDGWLAYQLRAEAPDTARTDSVKVKKENEKNGSRLVIRQLAGGKEDTIPFVKDYIAAEEGPAFLLSSTGNDSSFQAGIYYFDGRAGRLLPLLESEGEYRGLTLDEEGRQAAFLAFPDTADIRAKPFGLYYWKAPLEEAQLLADTSAAFLPDGWFISEHNTPLFSRDGQKLFFGLAPPPILPDTTLLPEEIVNVEVWASTEGRLYTHEEERLEEEKKRSYRYAYHIAKEKFVPLGSPETPEVQLGNEGNAAVALGTDEAPYLQRLSWEGFPACKDVYLIKLEDGERTLLAKAVCGTPRLSPEAHYVYWYSQPDSAWFAYSVAGGWLKQLAPGLDAPLYDELNDRPMHPSPYGIAGWTTGDDFILIYDRYDLWLIDPTGTLAPNNLTNGRKERKRYRYIRLDPEERAIEEVAPMLFHTFRETDKKSGYCWFDIHTGVKEQVQEGPYQYARNVIKARRANAFLLTRESFGLFPDLLYSRQRLTTFDQASQANPQQERFRWGTAEPFRWAGAQGQNMEGILIKPEGFDPAQQYPMITYFYERYADELYRHWTPRFPRSVINFPYYASRGYVLFIPDIHYRVGYPGRSAVEAVTTGVSALLEEGFIDRERLGVQGHSWGGYQVAYLITQTNLFRCAESGAPVSNMTSAYGGIRWASGLSRMFQYEHTQSRIGGTLWEKPLHYIDNSPLFFADQIETPVLILHNDDDGAVPWYQGIEFFVALRRLGKPAWMLNYNGDPHGVKKKQNRRDFQQRMQQFFDYYLLEAPMPKWMQEGVPPIEKGISQGLEPAND